MKRSILQFVFLVSLGLLVSVPAFAQNRPVSGAKISFSENMWDFGYVPKSGTVTHTYMIKNIGTDTLIIVKVRPDCGCTSTPLTQRRIPPNESTEMKIFFDPRKVVTSEALKKLQVISNDPNNPFAETQFTAKINLANSLVKLTPTEINFDTVSGGAAEESRVITIENISGEKLSVKPIEGPGDSVEFSLDNRTLKPGESVQLVVKLKRGMASGNLHTSLTLDFESSKIARISIPIFGEIIGP
jgi:hypothetical protein